jgi:hypothetical protein
MIQKRAGAPQKKRRGHLLFVTLATKRGIKPLKAPVFCIQRLLMRKENSKASGKHSRDTPPKIGIISREERSLAAP